MDRPRVFLFTDIEGSTRLWEREPERMGAAVARHDALLRAAVEAHGGRIFKSLGDGVGAVFAEAGAALGAALDAQRSVRREPWAVGPLAIRVSLHAGPAEERDGDFFGPTLNRAARILELAHGGQVLVSAPVREAAAALPAGARLRDLGEHRLRDLAAPERVHQLLHGDLPAEFAPLRSLDASPHNLPLQLTAFLGRERELAEIETRLRGSRLTTLVGAAGCGKTRLALHAAAEVLPAHAGGTWLVELADLSDGARIGRAVAFALGMRPDEATPLVQQLADRIGNGHMLLVLDNCEHLLDDAARLANDLLRRCPHLRILATSREPLRIEGEAVYPLEPLPLPRAGAASPEEIGRAPSCRLFLEAARSADGNFSIDADGARRVASICRALDGVPLAIGLAAACVRRLDLAAIEAGLAHRFQLLRHGPRTAQPHHRSLQAALDWSYGILAPDEQALLRRLSVFAGGWTMESLRRVLGNGDTGGHDRLVDHSLVERRGERYRFLESVRAYAAARLAETPAEQRECRERHARFVERLVHKSNSALYTGDARAVADEVEAEIENIRAALGWMLQAPELFESGIGVASRFWVFCWMRAYMTEGREWIERYLAQDGAARLPALAAANAHYAAGVLAKESGDLPAARRHYESALSDESLLGRNEGFYATALSALANVVRIEGDLDRARELYETSIALNRKRGRARSVAGALDGLGRVEAQCGNHAVARDHHRESLRLFREERDQRGEIIALGSLGRAEHRLGDHEAAYRLLRESYRLSRRQRDRHQAAGALQHLARVVRERGQGERARRLLRTSLAMSWQSRAMIAVGECLREMAALEEDPRRRDRIGGAASALLGNPAGPARSRDFEAGRAMDPAAAVAYALGRQPGPGGGVQP